MRSRVCSWALVGIGLGLLALAALLYLRPWPESPGLVVEESHRVLEDLAPGSAHDVEFCIRNRTTRPLRIVGASYC